MKKKMSLALLSISLIFLVSLFFFFKTLASPGLTCTLRNVANCPVGETCVFSLYQEINSHAGDCNYGSWKVCCDDPGEILTSSVKTANCDPGLKETGVISLYDTSNSHAWNYSDSDGLYHVCLNSTSYNPLGCAIRSGSCDVGVNVVSLYQATNSHVANYSEYNTKLCCGHACEGTISVSNDVIDCTNTQFTVTVRNTGFKDLTVDINDTLWEDTSCDGTLDFVVDYHTFSDVFISSGNTVNRQWSTSQTVDPFACYNHTLYFCSKPFASAGNLCGKDTSSCLDEAMADNIAIVSDFGFQCNPIAGVCGNSVVNLGEECDVGTIRVVWGACKPYQKCGLPGWDADDPAAPCQCYNFTDIECIGCFYYDWCDSGYEPRNPSKSCCADLGGNPTECCVDENDPLIRYLNCSIAGAIRDVNVNAGDEYCYYKYTDMTGKCIDPNWLEHEAFQGC